MVKAYLGYSFKSMFFFLLDYIIATEIYTAMLYYSLKEHIESCILMV